jgi:hypothetical protein
MFDWLGGIFEVVKAFGQLVLWGLVSFVNVLILAIGTAIQGLVAMLPAMPDAPDAPSAGILGWVLWIIPLGPLVAGFMVFVTVWVSWLVIRIPLRWLKVV